MEKISVANIAEGQSFPHSIFLPSGQKLLTAGVVITGRHLRVLQNLQDPEVYLAESVDELAEAGLVHTVDRKSMRAGQTATHDVLGAGGALVLEQGDQIEAHHIDAMQEGAYAASKQQVEAQRKRRERMIMAEALVEQLERDSADLDLHVAASDHDIWKNHPAASARAWPEVDQLAHERSIFVERIRQWHSRLVAGLSIELSEVVSVVNELFPLLLDHPQRFTQMALLCPRRDNYLPDHALCVTVLAMATAGRMSWSQQHVKHIGALGLLYDAGMLLVPERIRIGGCALSEVDRQRVQRHSAYSVALMEYVPGLGTLTKLAMLQHHERETGVGYPTGVKSNQICDYAKLLAIADVFAAATSPRAYQAPKLPYVVMEEIIRSAAAGIFHKPAVRALVQAAGLFPVGSCVLLSTRQFAHVLAANPNRLDRPIIRLLDKENRPTNLVIDLAIIPVEKLSVIRPAPMPQVISDTAA